MSNRWIVVLAVTSSLCAGVASGSSGRIERQFRSSAGGELVLDLKAGGDVSIVGSGGSSIAVAGDYDCTPECEFEFEESARGLRIVNRFAEQVGNSNSSIDLEIRVPSRYDLRLDSMGGALSLDGVEGTFRGKTMGGEITLHGVTGTAELTTMGGKVRITESDLDGSVNTMGGEVLVEDVVGDVRASSMGGNVRYKNVRRRDGGQGSPARLGDLDEATGETVQISTQGGAIEVEEAPEGADLHTMGGNVRVRKARDFVRAKTMGGDIDLDAVDGWIRATTMGGDIRATLVGAGGDVTLKSMSGDVTLVVPAGFGMVLDLEIAYTRNSSQDYRIDVPGSLRSSVTPEWDYDHGSPRKYIRTSGAVGGGGHAVKIETINGNITILEER